MSQKSLLSHHELCLVFRMCRERFLATLRVWSRGRVAGSSNILPKSGLSVLGK